MYFHIVAVCTLIWDNFQVMFLKLEVNIVTGGGSISSRALFGRMLVCLKINKKAATLWRFVLCTREELNYEDLTQGGSSVFK